MICQVIVIQTLKFVESLDVCQIIANKRSRRVKRNITRVNEAPSIIGGKSTIDIAIGDPANIDNELKRSNQVLFRLQNFSNIVANRNI